MKITYSPKYILILLITIVFIGCNRADEDEDVLSQEDISNIILNVKDELTGTTTTYNYTINSATNPEIKLTDGRSYSVNAVFLNGNEDETQSIIEAKDEHFLIFNFQSSNVILERTDDASSTRSDGNRVGLSTKWQVVKAKNGNNPQLILTLIHDPTTTSETRNGTIFGSVEGGETDAMATYTIAN